MWNLVRRRLIDAIVVVCGVGVLSFGLLHLAPGDPVAASLSDPRVAPSVRAHWRAVYALDRPLGEQLVRYAIAIARGDLGYSVSQHRPVADALADALPRSLLLIGPALLLSGVLGVLIALWQAVHEHTLRTRALAAVTSALSAVPEAWLALMLLTLFGAQLALVPLNGMCDPLTCSTMHGTAALRDVAYHAILPILTLTLVMTAAFARIQRVSLAAILHDDAMRTAFAKGVSEWRALWRHAMPQATRPLLTSIGLSLPMLIGGAVFVERVYGWPGMGNIVVDAVATRDYPLVTAIAMAGSVLVMAGGLITDLLSAWLDPRLRISGTTDNA